MPAPMIPYVAPRKRPRRRNPEFSVRAFSALLKEHGRTRAAELVQKYPDVVEPHLGAIEARLAARGFLNKPLSDVDAWTELAWLAPKVLAGEEAGLVDAAVREFERAAHR